MTDTKEFPTADVLSTISGVLISKIDGVYAVLNWMTGESVFTHQIPRISREAAPVLLAKHGPFLQQAIDEAAQVTPENYQSWRDTWENRYGPAIAVPKFSVETHERIDPMSELAEHFRPDQTIVVKPGE